MNKNMNNTENAVMMNKAEMREMYVKPECVVYAIEAEGVLCGSLDVDNDDFGGSWGSSSSRPSAW